MEQCNTYKWVNLIHVALILESSDVLASSRDPWGKLEEGLHWWLGRAIIATRLLRNCIDPTHACGLFSSIETKGMELFWIVMISNTYYSLLLVVFLLCGCSRVLKNVLSTPSEVLFVYLYRFCSWGTMTIQTKLNYVRLISILNNLPISWSLSLRVLILKQGDDIGTI